MIKLTNVQIFVVVVDHRDEDLFSVLETNFNKNELVWGLREKDYNVWTKLNYGDIICMMLENSTRCSLYGKINKTNIDTELPKKWGRDVRTLQMTHMVYFTKLHKLRGLLDNVQRQAIQNKINSPGIYQISANNIKVIKGLEEVETDDDHSVMLPKDLAGPPARVKCKVIRFVRDTQKSRMLKKIYENKCQVCGYQLKIGAKMYYSEVHHIRPLNEGGNDDFNNMIVLCPTHHAEFDYEVICINEDLTHVVDKNCNKVGTITLTSEHAIELANIRYSLKRVCH